MSTDYPWDRAPWWSRGARPGAMASLDSQLSLDTFARAFRLVARSPSAGIDGVDAGAFARRLDDNLGRLQQDVRLRRYRPAPLLRLVRPKSGGRLRHLGIPTIRDRTLQRAVLDAALPRIEASLGAEVHGYRPGRSPRTALADLEGVGQHPWLELVQVDVSGLFDNLDRRLVQHAADLAWGDETWSWLNRRWLGAWSGPTPGLGVPQGAPLSPALANLLLARHLDPHLRGSPGTPASDQPLAWVRYGDDIVVVVGSPGAGARWVGRLAGLLAGCGLEVAPDKASVARPGAGVLRVLGTPIRIQSGPEGCRLVC